jgi:kumamolisin
MSIQMNGIKFKGKPGLLFKAVGIFLCLSNSPPVVADASDARVALADSVQTVDEIPPTPADPHKPYITRRALQASETEQTLNFEVTLKMRDFAGLQKRVANGEHVSPQEMANKYYPAAADYQKVVDWLAQEGFTIRRQDSSRMSVFASATVDQLQNGLSITFARVTMDGTEYTSAITAPQVPTEVASLVVGINGLQPHLRMHRHVILGPDSTTGSGAPYEPGQLAQAYDAMSLYDSNVTGTGQTIAIVIDTFPLQTDLNLFWNAYGVTRGDSATVTFVQVVSGTLPSPSGEETLDTEWSSSLAPGANVRVYATKDLEFSDIDEAYAAIYSDVINTPALAIHQMTMSFGAAEYYVSSSQLTTDDQYFTELAAAGVTIFASSGDVGATPSSSGTAGGRHETPETPASDPNVTGVGGTSLTVYSSGQEATEVVWNNSYGASGGGVSSHFAEPSWQTGSTVPTSTKRMVPDVASSADPENGAYVVLNGTTYEYGGTSWGSPTWAAFCALLNQSRAAANLSSLGLLGPTIYPLVGTTNFRDITSGNNIFDSKSGYTAGVGYDLVTGCGVPDMAILAQTVTSSVNKATPIPNLLSAASVQLHAGTPYPISLPLTGNEGVECRAINEALQLVFTFDQAMSSGMAEVTTGTGSVTGTPTFNGDTMTVNLTGVTDAQNLTVTVSGLNGTSGTATLTFGVLEGDVNGDGYVNSPDLAAVRNAVGEVAGNSNFTPRADINEDGYVNSPDLAQVRNHVGHELP